MLTNAGTIIATIANFAWPSARIILLPIMHNARNGTESIIGKKNSSAGCTIAPFAPKSANISSLNKSPIATKKQDSSRVIMI